MPHQSTSGNGGRSSVQKPNGATTADQRKFQDHRLPSGNGHVSIGGEADLLLGALLKIEECDLEVEGLTAHVSVEAEVADLVKLAIGADVNLEKLKLTLEGVDVQSLLKVSLDQIRDILDKALTTIGEHPEILLGGLTLEAASVAPVLEQRANEAEQTVQPAVDESVIAIIRAVGVPRRSSKGHRHSA